MAGFDFLEMWKSLTEDEKKKLANEAQGAQLLATDAPVEVQAPPAPALLDTVETGSVAPVEEEKKGFRLGLLDGLLPEDEAKREAALMGMLQGFGGLMVAGGPSLTPTNFLGNVGSAINVGAQGYANARKDAREQAESDATLRTNKAKTDALSLAQKTADALGSSGVSMNGSRDPETGYSIPQLMQLHRAYLSAGELSAANSILDKIQRLQQAGAEKGMVAGENGFELADGFAESTTELERAKDAGQWTTSRKDYQTYVDQELEAGREPTDMTTWERQNKAAGSTRIINNNGVNSSKFDEESDKLAATRMNDIVVAGQSAPQMISDMNTLQELGKNLQTGKIAQFTAMIGPYAEALGIEIEGLGEAQAYEAIVSRLAPQMRPAGAGATSDFDAKQYLRSLPSLGNSPEGNEIISITNSAMAEHKIAAAEIARRAQKKEITWQQAEEEMAALPNPYARFKEFQKANGKQTSGLLDIGTSSKTERAGDVPTVNTDAERAKIPSGTEFIYKGRRYRQP